MVINYIASRKVKSKARNRKFHGNRFTQKQLNPALSKGTAKKGTAKKGTAKETNEISISTSAKKIKNDKFSKKKYFFYKL